MRTTILLTGLLTMTLAHAAPRLALIGAPPQNAFATAGPATRPDAGPGRGADAGGLRCPADVRSGLPASQPLSPSAQQATGRLPRRRQGRLRRVCAAAGPRGRHATDGRLRAPRRRLETAFAALPKLTVLEEHASRYPAAHRRRRERACTLLAYAKVAGMDRAVFGLPDRSRSRRWWNCPVGRVACSSPAPR